MMNQNEIEARKQELTNEALEQVVGGGKVRQAEGKTVYTVGLGDTLRNITDMHQNSEFGAVPPDTELIIC